MNANEIVIVSGLPRSGTSLMMQMLAAGGMPVLTDALRTPDESNPRGYFEFDAVKKLRADRSWLEQARGHAVKIIHLLLRELPTDGSFTYRVLFMERAIREVLASQRKMLARSGKPAGDAALLEKTFAAQIAQVKEWMNANSCFAFRVIDHRRSIEQPAFVAAEVREFLERELDPEKMAQAVDPTLYRERQSLD